MQVYTGGYRKPSTTAVQCVQDLSGVQIGHLVAVYSDDQQIEPWIGRVTAILEEEIEVIWLEGNYNSKWKNAKKKDPINKRKQIDWMDLIPKNSIILFAFELTTTSHLRKKTIDHLKKVYEEIRQQSTD